MSWLESLGSFFGGKSLERLKLGSDDCDRLSPRFWSKLYISYSARYPRNSSAPRSPLVDPFIEDRSTRSDLTSRIKYTGIESLVHEATFKPNIQGAIVLEHLK